MYSSDKLYITVSDHAALNCSQEDWDCCEAVMIGGKDEILLLIKDLQKILSEKFDTETLFSEVVDIRPRATEQQMRNLVELLKEVEND